MKLISKRMQNEKYTLMNDYMTYGLFHFSTGEKMLRHNCQKVIVGDNDGEDGGGK